MTTSPTKMSPEELREFLTIMQEFGVFECAVGEMSFKIAPTGPLMRQDETSDERKTRIRDELKRISDEDAEAETWST